MERRTRFFYELFHLTTWEDSAIGQNLIFVKNGAQRFIDKYSKNADEIELKFDGFFSDTVISEIDFDRPVVGCFLLQDIYDPSMHVVLIYGYAYHEGELGFIVHWGHYGNHTRVWVPENWFGWMVTMHSSHCHDLTSGTDFDLAYMRCRCTTCGAEILDNIYKTNLARNEIVGFRYPRSGNLTLPEKIYNIDIEGIGTEAFKNGTFNEVNIPSGIKNISSSAFENCSNLTTINFGGNLVNIADLAFSNCTNLKTINLPLGFESLGSKSFYNCSALERIEIPETVQYIGAGAFAGCDNLDIVVAEGNNNFSAYNNVLYNVNQTRIVASGRIEGDLVIPASIKGIAPYAFENNDNLQSVVFESGDIDIGLHAFAYCQNLEEVYFYSYEVPTLGASAFVDNNFALYVPHSARNDFYDVFSGYTTDIRYIPTLVTFVSDGETAYTQTLYYGEQITALPEPKKSGYTFTGWLLGDKPVAVGDVWDRSSDETLVADWQPNVYNLSFSGEGTETLQSIQATFDETVTELPVPQRYGYTFDGWNTVSDGSGQTVIAPFVYTTAADTTLYATWQLSEFSIAYNLHGGENSDENPSRYTVENNVVFQAPSRKGYVFVCWQCNGSDITETAGNAADLTLDAVWLAETYSVTLNAAGGTVDTENYQVIYDQSYVFAIPVREGYDFDGWFDANGVRYTLATGEGVALWQTCEDTNLTAHWMVKQYEIQINDNGSITWLGANGFSDESCDIAYGTPINSINLIAVFKQSNAGYKDGKIFDHFEYDGENLDWTTVPDLGASGTVVTIIPVWIWEEQTIYFNTKCDIVLDSIAGHFGDALVLPETKRNGYSFVGWATSADSDQCVAWTKIPDLTLNEQGNGSVMLYAVYSLLQYKITYDLGGGTNAEENPHFYNIESEVVFSDPSRVGYIFNGWYKDVDFVERIVELRRDFGDKTIFAKWKPISYTVKYESNGGTGFMESSVHDYDVKKPLACNSFIKKGYSFKGWATSPNGEVAFADIANVENLTSENGAIVTLFAKWSANQYTVTFDKSGGSGGTDTQTVTYDQPMPQIVAPALLDYNFVGYYTKVNGAYDKMYYAGALAQGENTVWDIDCDTTLYAKWERKLYNVTLHYTCNYGDETVVVQVGYGDPMPEYTDYAPMRTGYTFVGYFAQPDGAGQKYYSMTVANDQETANMEATEYHYYEKLTSVANWDKHADGSIYAYHKLLELDYNYRCVVENGNVLKTVKVHIKHNQDLTVTAPNIDGYTFKYWYDSDFNKIESQTATLRQMSIRRSTGTGKVVLSSTFSAIYVEDSCVAAGTLITLADGRQVPVENLTGNESLLVWNLHTGKLDVAKIVFVDYESQVLRTVVNLHFSDGTSVKVVGEHAFWDFDLNRYVYLRGDAARYIGHSFYKLSETADGIQSYCRVQLSCVEVFEEKVAVYSPVTAEHLCYFVNGMLSVPGGIEGLFNIFEVDANTMSYDAESMAADIAKYGLFTYEEFASILPVSRQVFDAFNGQFLKVALGKGLISVERLEALLVRYSAFL